MMRQAAPGFEHAGQQAVVGVVVVVGGAGEAGLVKQHGVHVGEQGGGAVALHALGGGVGQVVQGAFGVGGIGVGQVVAGHGHGAGDQPAGVVQAGQGGLQRRPGVGVAVPGGGRGHGAGVGFGPRDQ